MGINVSTLIKSEQVSTLIQPGMPKKCRDPNTFTCSCTIGECTFAYTMLDLGTSINVIPSSIYRSLKLGDLEQTVIYSGQIILNDSKTKIGVHTRTLSMEFGDNMVYLSKRRDTIGGGSLTNEVATKVVPKKFGMTVVKNQNNELILTRVQNNWTTSLSHLLIKFWRGWQKINIRPPSLAHSAPLLTLGCLSICATPQAPSRGAWLCMILHLMHSWRVYLEFYKCVETNLVLNFEKCHFMVTKDIVLGHLVSSRGIEVDRDKIDIIASLSHPGSWEFEIHLRFQQNSIAIVYSSIVGCGELKKKLTTILILQAPNWELPFELMCQRVGKHSHVIAYASYTLNSTQQLLLHYINFFLIWIIVFSNHATLKFLLKKPDVKPRLIH
ncbi:hypothetical protein CR513_58945, partial [Mucuna pruriens]